jgi:hypothetical protein
MIIATPDRVLNEIEVETQLKQSIKVHRGRKTILVLTQIEVYQKKSELLLTKGTIAFVAG